MTDKELSALKALAQRIEDANEQPIAIGKDAAQAILSLISRVEQAEAASTERANNAIDQTILSMQEKRAQAGNTSVDLSGLKRYAASDYITRIGEMVESDDGEYVKLADVQALLATPARDVGGLTPDKMVDLFQVIATKHGIKDLSANGGKADGMIPLVLAELFNTIYNSQLEVLATSPAPSIKQEAESQHVPVELEAVEEQLKKGSGFWHTCSGCHESEDGHDNGPYPYSNILGCKLGMGCSECGGIGAVWDNTDYEAMAAEMFAAPSASQGEVSDWISVEDRLPDERVNVLVLEKYCDEPFVGSLYQGRWEASQTFYEACGDAWVRDRVDQQSVYCWMPLPAAPSVMDGEKK